MQPLDHDTYLKLRAGAQVLEQDKHGDKVLRLTDSSFLKLFRRKRALTSAALFPYAQRFANNADLLRARNILCPRVLDVYRISELERDAVHYEPLPGDTLRQLYQTHAETEHPELRKQLGAFIAELHDQGIYFRSLHLGNVVLTPEGRLGLIDIADLRSQRSRLNESKRLRNFRHLLRYSDDRNWLLPDSHQEFFDAYFAATQLSTSAKFHLRLKVL